MTTGFALAYAGVAAFLLVVCLLSTPQPRSVGLIALAVALWPLTLAAIIAHAIVAKTQHRPAGRPMRAAVAPAPAASRLPASG